MVTARALVLEVAVRHLAVLPLGWMYREAGVGVEVGVELVGDEEELELPLLEGPVVNVHVWLPLPLQVQSWV
jgi:hypothetical protein